MSQDNRIAPRLPGQPPPTSGICRFCKITEDRVDGNTRSWYGPDRTCCSLPVCIRRHHQEIASIRRNVQLEQHRRESGRRLRNSAIARGHLKGGAA